MSTYVAASQLEIKGEVEQFEGYGIALPMPAYSHSPRAGSAVQEWVPRQGTIVESVQPAYSKM